MARVYAKVGSEDIQRLIAREASVQAKLESEAEVIKGRAERNLASRKSRRLDPIEARRYRRGRSPARIYTKTAKIDRHIVLEGSAGFALKKGTARDAALEILRDAL